MNLRPFALFLSVVGMTLSQAATADACGVPEPQDTITRHFDALNSHDRARVLAQWNQGAPVVTLGAPTLIEPIERVATRWVQAKESTTFHVDKLEEGENTATAYVTVTAGGKTFSDTILLTSTHGAWRIAGITVARVKAASPYGS